MTDQPTDRQTKRVKGMLQSLYWYPVLCMLRRFFRNALIKYLARKTMITTAQREPSTLRYQIINIQHVQKTNQCKQGSVKDRTIHTLRRYLLCLQNKIMQNFPNTIQSVFISGYYRYPDFTICLPFKKVETALGDIVDKIRVSMILDMEYLVLVITLFRWAICHCFLHD